MGVIRELKTAGFLALCFTAQAFVSIRPYGKMPTARALYATLPSVGSVGPRTHLHTHWRASVGHRHTRRTYARICLMGDPSQTAAPAAFRLGAAIKARYLQVFKANAILARHPCQTAAAHLPCTRPPDNWSLFRQNPPALASQTDLAGPHAATQGLIYAMGTDPQHGEFCGHYNLSPK